MKGLLSLLLVTLAIGCSFEKKTTSETPTDTLSVPEQAQQPAANDTDTPAGDMDDVEEDPVPGNEMAPEVRVRIIERTMSVMKTWQVYTEGSEELELELWDTNLLPSGAPAEATKTVTVKVGAYVGGPGWLSRAFEESIDESRSESGSQPADDLENVLYALSGLSLSMNKNAIPFHYINPDVIRWTFKNFYFSPPGTDGGNDLSLFPGHIKPEEIYRVNFKQSVRTLAVAHEQLSTGFDEEMQWYKKVIIRGGGYAPDTLRSRYVVPEELKIYVNTQYYALDAGFWVRRRIDGTESLLWEYLKTVLFDYDSRWACNNLKVCRLSH